MINTYRTIRLPGRAEITEKKSSFIGQAIHAESAGEAEEFYLTVRRKYYDARHHCFAYITGEPGTPQEVRRMSDDGEPGVGAGGSAGILGGDDQGLVAAALEVFQDSKD